jgi:hypothetical protein
MPVAPSHSDLHVYKGGHRMPLSYLPFIECQACGYETKGVHLPERCPRCFGSRTLVHSWRRNVVGLSSSDKVSPTARRRKYGLRLASATGHPLTDLTPGLSRPDAA